MIDFKDKIYIGSNQRKSLFDCEIPDDAKAVIIFVHGYKGYKDWGAWGLLQQKMVSEGFGFVKFNMTHNGGTIEDKMDFSDLDAFGENRYSYEINDLNVIVDEIDRILSSELEVSIPIYILGHSRGGGVAILTAGHNEKIKKVVSLAGISDIESRFPTGENFEVWKKEGVYTVLNGRTNQKMPHFFSFYEDFIEFKEELNIEKACQHLSVPFLQIHGDMDLAVSISEGLAIAQWTDTELLIIKGAEHTFGTYHPYDKTQLPEEMNDVVDGLLEFFNT